MDVVKEICPFHDRDRCNLCCCSYVTSAMSSLGGWYSTGTYFNTSHFCLASLCWAIMWHATLHGPHHPLSLLLAAEETIVLLWTLKGVDVTANFFFLAWGNVWTHRCLGWANWEASCLATACWWWQTWAATLQPGMSLPLTVLSSPPLLFDQELPAMVWSGKTEFSLTWTARLGDCNGVEGHHRGSWRLTRYQEWDFLWKNDKCCIGGTQKSTMY